MHARLAVPLAVAGLALGGAANAPAATISAAPDPGSSNETLARYVAAPGEVNDVTVTNVDVHTVRVSDPGAVIAAGANCTSIDAHTAQCASPAAPSRRFLDFLTAELGDGNDRVQSVGRLGKGLNANGGPGGDTLIGSRGLADELDGGGGHDVLRGRGNSDTLVDGDATGAADGDVLDGGAGRDIVSYARRTAPVLVDLAGAGADGEEGEGDVLTSIEVVIGGSGDDRLAGTGGADTLEGRGGDDRLDGRGGADVLYGGSGRDVVLGRRGEDFLTGGAGRDRLVGAQGSDALIPKSGGDDVDCGRAIDSVIGPRPGDFLQPGCEQAAFARAGVQLTTDAYPIARRAASVDFRVRCPRPEILDGLSEPIRGSLRVREAGGRHRTLATGTIRRRAGRRCGDEPVPDNGVTATVHLTSLGRGLASRHRGVRATVHLRGHNLLDVAWTIRLRSR